MALDFIDQVKQFSKRVESLKDSISTEEATKTSIIMPFFALLGYDIFNPEEFTPEYVADVGIKKGEKVDYAILQNGEPVVLIEAKAIDKKLNNHSSQLYRYFGASQAKFAILTNGIQYRFYTDLEESNKMDPSPFLQIDLFNLKNFQIEELKKFQKSAFSISNILDSASILKFKNDFKINIANQLEDPSDDFVKLFLQDVYSGMKTQSVILKFRPILKQALEEYINETMSDKIQSALNVTNLANTPSPSHETVLPSSQKATTSKMELSEDEESAYHKLCDILAPYIDTKQLTFKKTENYVAFLLQDNVRKWICRVIVNTSGKYLILPDQNKQEIKRYLSNWFELENYGPYLISVANRFTELCTPLDLSSVKIYTISLKRRFPKRKRQAL